MKRASAALATLLAACAVDRPALPPPPPEAPEAGPIAAEDAEADVAEIGPEAPPERAEVVWSAKDAERIEALRIVARNVLDAFANTTPRPVIRGFTKATWVQYETDRRERGKPEWVEAPTMALHGAPLPPEALEPCVHPIEPGHETSTTWGGVFLDRGADHDTLIFRPSGKKQIAAKLPRGSAHGACLGPDATRVWIGWSTPIAPPEIFSVAIRDGAVRPLRLDARPGLGAVTDVRSFAVALADTHEATVVVPSEGEVGASAIVVAAWTPLARWDALARFLASAGAAVLVVPAASVESAIAYAKAHWPAPTVVARGGSAPDAGDAPLVQLVAPGDDVAPPRPRTLVVGTGEATRDAIRASLATAPDDVTWTVATGATKRDETTLAWARAAAAILAARR